MYQKMINFLCKHFTIQVYPEEPDETRGTLISMINCTSYDPTECKNNGEWEYYNNHADHRDLERAITISCEQGK